VARLVDIFCMVCECRKTVCVSSSDMPPMSCDDCIEKDVKAKRVTHFAELDKLTIEQRLRKIEEWIYDYRPRHVPEPRF
jgi:hypothetical protein